MKKLMITAALFLAVTGAAMAQTGPGKREQATPEQRAEKMTAHLDKSLSLSSAQREKIYAINLDRAKTMNGKRGKADKQEWKKSAEANENKLLSVLNSDQKKAYQKIKADRHAKHAGRKGKNHPGKQKV
ncbi:DUF4890 domain-containing protein [Hufsiella ginkgonis]|uniref:DUF4890 domain-containing protein n=1 Tax=Hufsiella ginkgonis TaxID=2695274 RepID=A0A7K1XXQ9_9SPHI|nr:DUF4890 domain-containing protein [Hufsiella ginkgonis]MXV15519.1 DUF4890 domain-containing protein [Hufsiella ginkgonis]